MDVFVRFVYLVAVGGSYEMCILFQTRRYISGIFVTLLMKISYWIRNIILQICFIPHANDVIRNNRIISIQIMRYLDYVELKL